MDSWALGAAGRFDESLQMMERAQKQVGGEFTPAMRWNTSCLVKLGRPDEARQILHKLEDRSRHGYRSAEQIAHIYSAVGERGPALKWLHKAYEQRAFGMTFLDAFPACDFLRGDRDYERIRAAMRLPGPWD